LIFEFQSAPLAVIEILSFDVNVEVALIVLVVLASPEQLRLLSSALGSVAGVLVVKRVQGFVSRSYGLPGGGASRRATHVIDVELVLLVVLGVGVLVDECAPLGGGLQVVAHEEVVEFAEGFIKLDLHLTNIDKNINIT
jgi:hypothetical protein